ncbi:hypothetical protein HanXRQr2_Chr09g0368571 [Helianthus annuus]|uniref:Uncharacterized protein n=1 Tax=Helianthus annuus TaxID=4232 RepID=A0A9K3I2I8_HELAN|nr:hypothetical protein HanXRQr2_Chr09g0368571 [Helianthus annuus]
MAMLSRVNQVKGVSALSDGRGFHWTCIHKRGSSRYFHDNNRLETLSENGAT